MLLLTPVYIENMRRGWMDLETRGKTNHHNNPLNNKLKIFFHVMFILFLFYYEVVKKCSRTSVLGFHCWYAVAGQLAFPRTPKSTLSPTPRKPSAQVAYAGRAQGARVPPLQTKRENNTLFSQHCFISKILWCSLSTRHYGNVKASLETAVNVNCLLPIPNTRFTHSVIPWICVNSCSIMSQICQSKHLSLTQYTPLFLCAEHSSWVSV